MKKKNIAGVLALFAGYIGLHRFYLGQVGLGIAYIFLIPILVASGMWFMSFLGLLDAVLFFTMDRDAFDAKYNKDYFEDRQRPRHRTKRAKERDAKRSKRTTKGTTDDRHKTSLKKMKPSRAKSTAFLKEGISKFKDYDFEGAIVDFENALKHDPQHIATHFNLACAHSLMENKDKAFYHLDRAVALGFDDFNTIKTRDHLAYIRIQKEFEQFESNGFRLAKQLKTPQEDLLNKQPTAKPTAENTALLEQLQRLATLKEKGLLTEAEFSAQKEKLLG